MGHDFIVFRGAHAQFNDMDLWTVRHFLLTAARDIAREDASEDSYAAVAFFDRWDWPGPGVFFGTDFDAFIGESQTRLPLLLRTADRARNRIAVFGLTIPLSYLEAHVNLRTAYYTLPLSIVGPQNAIDRLVALLRQLPVPPPA